MASATLSRDQDSHGLSPAASAADTATQFGVFDALVQTRSSREALRLRLYVALLLSDIIVVFLAFALANLARFGDPLHNSRVDLFVLVLPIFLGVAINNRAYSIDVLNDPRKSVLRAAQALAFAIVAVIGIIFYLKASDQFSRLVMAGGTAGAMIFVCASRWSIGRLIGKCYDWRFTNELLFVDEVAIRPQRGEIVIFADKLSLAPSSSDPDMLDRIGRLMKNCDRVILACPPERRASWSAMLKGADVDVEVLAPELDDVGALGTGKFGDRSTLLISRGPLGLRDRFVKRCFDLVVATCALLLLAPLLLVVALAIKLDSPGPVFFRQPRVGLGNRTFDMIKFRSMHVEMADAFASRLTQIGDARVTRVGAFLRRSSLDELPQLFNVWSGDMSIAGPRPHATGALAGDSFYWEVDSRYWHRHAVKPGMTGLAQVRGFRGTTFQQRDLTNRLQADLEYLVGWTLWRDIMILAATVRVLTHRNAF